MSDSRVNKQRRTERRTRQAERARQIAILDAIAVNAEQVRYDLAAR